jgi:hypothetical protein
MICLRVLYPTSAPFDARRIYESFAFTTMSEAERFCDDILRGQSNIPNYASAIVSTDEIVDSISPR